MSAYLSVDIEHCRTRGHHLITAGSDAKPMKLNIICMTCSVANPGKTAYAAYGTDIGSFGQWRRKKIDEETE